MSEVVSDIMKQVVTSWTNLHLFCCFFCDLTSQLLTTKDIDLLVERNEYFGEKLRGGLKNFRAFNVSKLSLYFDNFFILVFFFFLSKFNKSKKKYGILAKSFYL